ncbi:MAG: hypothetical protein QNJ44_06660 [Rhodobacter sp.]|nr:hypothetical protein [Rhodobacter sp.]
MRIWLSILALAWLAACGVDGPPVPPGQENPDTISDPSEFDPDRFF